MINEIKAREKCKKKKGKLFKDSSALNIDNWMFCVKLPHFGLHLGYNAASYPFSWALNSSLWHFMALYGLFMCNFAINMCATWRIRNVSLSFFRFDNC